MFNDFVPQSKDTLRAQLDAWNSGSDPEGIVPLPPALAGQKLATLIRAEHPPVPEADHDEIRAIMPGLIVLSEKLTSSDDLMTHWHGYGLMMLTTGIAVGMRRVPLGVFSKIQGDNETVAERQLTVRVLAMLLCDTYPSISDEEFAQVEPTMVHLTDVGEREMRVDDYRICMRGTAMLMLALGICIGLRKIPFSIWKEYVPAHIVE